MKNYTAMTKFFKKIFIFFLLYIGVLIISKYPNEHDAEFVLSEIKKTRIIENRQALVKTDQIEKKQLLRSIHCMAKNIYFEARGEPFLGQVAVARVVMNRVRDVSFPNKICEVIYQKNKLFLDDGTFKLICQFSWVCEYKKPPDTRSASYRIAMDIAKKVIVQNLWSGLLADNVLYFHSNYVNPNWGLQHAKTIGKHKFFTDKKIVDKK